MKEFSLTPTTHVYSHPLTFMEATICLMLEDKLKDFTVAAKLLVQNAKYLDSHFGLTPLKSNPDKSSKIIIAEEDVPSNFTHLGYIHLPLGTEFLRRRKTGRRARRSKLIAMIQLRTSRTLSCTSPLQSPPIFNPVL
jgi:hypothetical protein